MTRQAESAVTVDGDWGPMPLRCPRCGGRSMLWTVCWARVDAKGMPTHLVSAFGAAEDIVECGACDLKAPSERFRPPWHDTEERPLTPTERCEAAAWLAEWVGE